MRTPAAFAAARPFVKKRPRPPDLELLRDDPSPEAVAAIAPPVLSSGHGFP
jgi:hypothetical protein